MELETRALRLTDIKTNAERFSARAILPNTVIGRFAAEKPILSSVAGRAFFNTSPALYELTPIDLHRPS